MACDPMMTRSLRFAAAGRGPASRGSEQPEVARRMVRVVRSWTVATACEPAPHRSRLGEAVHEVDALRRASRGGNCCSPRTHSQQLLALPDGHGDRRHDACPGVTVRRGLADLMNAVTRSPSTCASAGISSRHRSPSRRSGPAPRWSQVQADVRRTASRCAAVGADVERAVTSQVKTGGSGPAPRRTRSARSSASSSRRSIAPAICAVWSSKQQRRDRPPPPPARSERSMPDPDVAAHRLENGKPEALHERTTKQGREPVKALEVRLGDPLGEVDALRHAEVRRRDSREFLLVRIAAGQHQRRPVARLGRGRRPGR